MAFTNTVDERFHGGGDSLPAGTEDAAGVLNDDTVLAEGDPGWGALVNRGTPDIDIYALGTLQPGTYVIEVSNETWDPGTFEGGSVASASLLRGDGTVLGTRDGSVYLESFTLSVPAAQDFYLRVNGGLSTSVQYNVSYTRLGAAGLTAVVNTESSRTLAATELHLVMGGSGDIDGTGNAHNNVMFGNTGDNVLKGLGGSDRLIGGGGRDRLDGGRDEDRLAGGAASDLYFVDNRNDVVFENAGEGSDGVVARDSFTLPDEVENLVLAGRKGIEGTGNGAVNVLLGNRGDNLLEGRGGSDVLQGARGADFLQGGRGDDFFAYMSIADSTRRQSDRIDDFRDGDTIHLSEIDANTRRSGDQDFDLIRGGFGDKAGELRQAGRMLLGDTDGDGRAELAIELPRNASISGGDLIL